MKHTLFSIFLLFVVSAVSANDTTVVEKRIPSFVALGGGFGGVMPTNSFVSEPYKTNYGALSLKYALTSTGDKWQDIAYGLPYYGIGISQTYFGRPDDLGVPASLYLFQGATILNFSKRTALNYEFNLGFATGWNPYDPFTNPNNIAIGSTMNVHVAANVYLKWYLSRDLDLHIGGNFIHFSNGTSRQPNHGINKAGAYIELVYNFNRDQLEKRYDSKIKIPDFKPGFEHDLQVIISSKNVMADTVGTNLPDVYNDKQFDVYGVNYYLMRQSSYRYRYGFGIEYLYDASQGAKMYNRLHPTNGRYYPVTELGTLQERSSVGVAARGELVLPLYSIFMDIGTTILNRDEDLPFLYQAIGVKAYLSDDLFGTFGIKAVNFGRAQFLYWSLGYTFNSSRNSWRRRQ